MQQTDSIGEFLAKADSMQRELHIHDWFGRRIRLPVQSMHYASFTDINPPPTFEAIRLAMIAALAEQTSWAQALKLSNGKPYDQRRKEATELTDTSRRIAHLIDSLVHSASPHLVTCNIELACSHLNKLWIPSFRDEPPDTLKIPGALPPSEPAGEKDGSLDDDAYILSGVPSECPRTLKKRTAEMLYAFRQTGIGNKSREEDWEKATHSRLESAYPKLPSFAATLRAFGQNLFDRSADQRKRIEEAVEQTGEILSIMRFCHLIILTQLDAPADWLFDAKQEETWFPIKSFVLTAAGITVSSQSVDPTALALADTAIILGFGIMALSIVMNLVTSARPKEEDQVKFDSKLQLSLDVLKVPANDRLHYGLIQERCIAELEEFKSDTDYIESLRKKMASRLDRKYKPAADSIPGVTTALSIRPKRWWANWLQMEARVARLRTIMSDRIRIGAEGLTEAGKSELLTTLAGAPDGIFKSGSSLNCRTIDIQSYAPEELIATFLDCPGSDDSDFRVRETSRLFRDMFDVVLFVVPCGEQRSQRTERYLEEVATFLKTRKDTRPVRILLSKADMFNFHRRKLGEFEEKIAANKAVVIEKIRDLGDLGHGFVTRCRKAVQSSQGTGVIMGTESLEDIVQPYSTFAQMSYDCKKALSDCGEDEDPMIQEKPKLLHLQWMAEQGLLWDVESLRQWLRTIAAKTVPESQRRHFDKSS